MYSYFLLLFISFNIIFEVKSLKQRELEITYEPNLETLQLVHVVFRHGDRTTFLSYPKDPHRNETFYPIGPGGLTIKGKRREFKLGEELRRIYGKFLGDIVTQNLVTGFSSGAYRTKSSLLLVLAGLFPPKRDQIWSENLNWQPIPTNYVQEEGDKYFHGFFCNESRKIYEDYIHTNEYKNLIKNDKKLFLYLTEKSGWVFNNYGMALQLYSVFRIYDDFGFGIPEWGKIYYPKVLDQLVLKFYKSVMEHFELKKYAIGSMVGKILKEMRDKINGNLNTDKKIFLYSGHETNLVFLMLLLDANILENPPYGSYFVFELHKIDGEFALQVNTIVKDYLPCFILKICFRSFIRIIKKSILLY